MRIQRVISNNVITILEEDGKEAVAMGCGIGFHMRPGQYVDDDKIEKIYRMQKGEELERFEQLLKNLPLEYLQISNEIIAFAQKALAMELNQNVYITLTDHISFAISRFREGTFFSNALENEIEYFYRSEYGVGQRALDLIEQKTGVRLPEGEASSIAIHIVNAELGINVSGAFRLTGALQEILKLLEKERWFPKEEGYEKKLFLTNLKFLVHRTLFVQRLEVEDKKLSEFIRTTYAEEYRTVQDIKHFLEEEYQCTMQPDEEIYLTLDIKRVKENTKREDG